jgi:hypothetical protein
MNEKLFEKLRNELSLGAGYYEGYDDNDLAKFAELIVQECADLYNHEDVLAPIGMSAWGEAHQHGWIEGTQAYRDTILEHFGVEE